MKNYTRKVLLYFTQNPYPGKTGTHKRCLTIIDAFQQLGYQITFLSHAEYGPYSWNQESRQYFEGKSVEVVLYHSSPIDQAFVAQAQLNNQDVLNLEYHCPPGLAGLFKKTYESLRPDVVFIFYIYSSGLLQAIDASDCTTIVDSIDLVSLSSALQQKLLPVLGPPPYEPWSVHPLSVNESFFSQLSLTPSNLEYSLYDLFNYTIAISRQEAEIISKNTNKTVVEHIPVTSSIPSTTNSYMGNPVFVAADNPFNIQAYLYLASRVMPALLQLYPQCEIQVVGEITKKLIPSDGINLRGFVPDLSELYATTCCAACPVIGGTGMSVKVLEAMAHGVPVVVLRNSTQESLIRHGIDGFIANDAQDFARYLAVLYNDRVLCAQMGAAARQMVVQNFSDAVVVQRIAKILSNCNKEQINKHISRIKVLYDISVLGLSLDYVDARTGIFRVVEHVARGLAKSSEIELTFCSTEAMMQYAPQTADACRRYLTLHPEFNHIPFGDATLSDADIFHSPFHGLPDAVTVPIRFLTVYDLIPVLFPHYVPQHSVNLQARMLHQLKLSDRCLCISQATKSDLCDYLGMSQEKAVVSYLAADPAIFYRCTDLQLQLAVRQKYNLGDAPYILSLCTLEPRKNIDHLLRAFARLVRERTIGNTRLVLTGTKGWDFDRIFSEIDNNSELHKRIILTGYVPDEELAPLYSGAQVFAYMSLYEGFGLPPLEAMQCGTPVITSITSSLPEVVGDAGIMLDPHDLDGLCQALVRMTTDQELRDDLAQRALNRATLFSWERCVEETIVAYRKALAGTEPLSAQRTEQAIVVDGVIFQLQQGQPFGISRLWQSMLTELGKLPIGRRIILLDRAGTAPELPGIKKRHIGAYTIGTAQDEAAGLDRLCAEQQASLFLSTYYTFTTATPSLLMLYDMIPERFDTVGPAAPNPEWRDKYHVIIQATAFAAISASTARDLAAYYPQVAMHPMAVVSCAVSEVFRPHSTEEIAAFRAASGITKPYFLLVGRRDQHKNVALFFQAFEKLPNRADYALVMAGTTQPLEPELREMAGDAEGYAGFFTDDALSLVYSGAVALIYPSRYEGFGLPILEAMQSDCPVITCQNSSIPEVAGSAALYVGEDAVDEMLQALQAVQQPEVREYLLKRGRQRAAHFCWQDSAGRLVQLIDEVEHSHV